MRSEYDKEQQEKLNNAKNKEFKIVNERTLKIYHKLKTLGNFLAFKINKTVSLKYLKFYK